MIRVEVIGAASRGGAALVLTLLQNVALVVVLATTQGYLAQVLSAYPRLRILASGSLYGAIAAVAMLVPFYFLPGILYDGRSIIMGLAGLFGGTPVALIAGVIAGGYRALLGGPGALAGMVTVVVSGALGVGMRRLIGGRLTSLRFSNLLIFGFVVHLVTLGLQCVFLPASLAFRVVREVGPLLLTLFPAATAIAAWVMIEQLAREEGRKALIAEAKRLHLAMAAADMGAWDYDVASRMTYLSTEAASLFGLGEKQVVLSDEDWSNGVHPDDRDALVAFFRRFQEAPAGRAVHYYRWRHPDGNYRWFQDTCLVDEPDAQGTSVRIIGVSADVTESRLADAAVERRVIEAELLAVASSRLLRARDTDAVFDIIRDFFAAELPGAILIINELDPAGDTLITRDLIGVSPDLVESVERIMGRAIRQSRFPVTTGYRRILDAGRMERIAGGLPQLVDDELPRATSSEIERILGVRESWSIGIADSGVAYACVHILMREAGTDIPCSGVESFANLCFVTLEGLYARERLSDSEERFRTLADTAPEAIFVQVEHRFSYVNGAMVRLYGAASADELLGQPVLDRVRVDFHDAANLRMKGLNKGRELQSSMQMVHLRVDGTEIDVETSGAPIVYEGSPGAVVFVRDVTEAKRSAIELERYREHLEELVAVRTQDLEAANAELKRTVEARMGFFARMSHELRTPLNSILGFSEVLLQRIPGPLTEEQSLEIGIINSAGHHLMSIINDLLDLLRAEAGRTVVNRELFSADELLDEVADILRPMTAESGLVLRVVASGSEVQITSDRMKVKRILLNLGGNAVKFTSEGYIELRVEDHGDGMVCFSVEDSGPGIRPEVIAQIFEPFAQGDVRSELSLDGSGLGLTISRELARLLGGRVDVSSQPGKGSTFSLVLPRILE